MWTAIYKALDAIADPRTIAMFEKHDKFTDDRIEKVVTRLRKMDFEPPSDDELASLSAQLEALRPSAGRCRGGQPTARSWENRRCHQRA